MVKLELTDAQLIKEMQSDSLLNQVRQLISNHHGKIEQASQQREPLTTVKLRRMEFEAALDVAKLLGVDLRADTGNR